jgi:SAM-dependent methyltransferase
MGPPRSSSEPSSEELSRSFYAQLGAEGLAGRTRPEFDREIVEALTGMIPVGSRVLDAGCGYGRVALPLARAGYDVIGLDLSKDMIRAAHDAVHGTETRLGLVVGSFSRLPFAAGRFDAVICLWSAFNELLEDREQVDAIREMWRVLAGGGIALIEGRPYTEATDEDIRSGVRRGVDHRVEWGLVEGILNPHYRHDERSFERICRSAGVERFRVYERDWGGRQRLFLRLDR